MVEIKIFGLGNASFPNFAIADSWLRVSHNAKVDCCDVIDIVTHNMIGEVVSINDTTPQQAINWAIAQIQSSCPKIVRDAFIAALDATKGTITPSEYVLANKGIWNAETRLKAAKALGAIEPLAGLTQDELDEREQAIDAMVIRLGIRYTYIDNAGSESWNKMIHPNWTVEANKAIKFNCHTEEYRRNRDLDGDMLNSGHSDVSSKIVWLFHPSIQSKIDGLTANQINQIKSL